MPVSLFIISLAIVLPNPLQQVAPSLANESEPSKYDTLIEEARLCLANPGRTKKNELRAFSIYEQLAEPNEVVHRKYRRFALECMGYMFENGIGVEKDLNQSFSCYFESASLNSGRPMCRIAMFYICLLYTSPSPRDRQKSRMPSSA